MKVIDLEEATLETCLVEAQQQRVVIRRGGRPVAYLVGLEGMDQEQLQRAGDERFWSLIAERRAQPTIGRAELEQGLKAPRHKPSDS